MSVSVIKSSPKIIIFLKIKRQTRFKPVCLTWLPLFWTCRLKCQQRSLWQHYRFIIWNIWYTLISNRATFDLKDMKWTSRWWYSFHAAQQRSRWGFVGSDGLLSLHLCYYFQALSLSVWMRSDGSALGSRALGRSGLRFTGLFWLGEQVLLSSYIN